MGAVEWEAQLKKLHTLMDLWEKSGAVKKGSPEIHARVLLLKSKERTRFWRAGFYPPEERSVRLTFDWRDQDTALTNRDWRRIEMTMKSQPTPWENLELLVKALNDLRLAFSRGNVRVLYGVLNQMWPPETGGAPRIIYKEKRIIERAGAHPPGSPYAALRVDEGVELDVCEAAYRALAKRYLLESATSSAAQGPDKMRQINLAIETIRTRNGVHRNRGEDSA